MMTEYEKLGWAAVRKAICESPLLQGITGRNETTDRELLELAASIGEQME